MYWQSYNSNSHISQVDGNINDEDLYSQMVTFFANNPTSKPVYQPYPGPTVSSGIVSYIQGTDYSNMSKSLTDDFDMNDYDGGYTAIRFQGLFTPTHSTTWTFYLGIHDVNNGSWVKNDDASIFFLAPPGSTLSPDANQTTLSSTPSATQAVFRNRYDIDTISVSLELEAGQAYPLQLLYVQSVGGYVVGLSFDYLTDPSDPSSHSALITDFTGYITPQMNNTSTLCFGEDTTLLTPDRGYVPIYLLQPGDLVTTLTSGDLPLQHVGKKEGGPWPMVVLNHPSSPSPLKVTGGHALLSKTFDSPQQDAAVRAFYKGKRYVTEGHYRIPACLSSHLSATEDATVLYHVVVHGLCANYGLWANQGIRVESCFLQQYLRANFQNINIRPSISSDLDKQTPIGIHDHGFFEQR
jgi:hypothetical protein